MIPVVIESPYAGDVERNLRYLRACMRDCICRGESPYASHALLTQEGVLDDLNPEERERGITAGYAWWPFVKKIVFYIDLGFSSGMRRALTRTTELGLVVEIEYRKLTGWES